MFPIIVGTLCDNIQVLRSDRATKELLLLYNPYNERFHIVSYSTYVQYVCILKISVCLGVFMLLNLESALARGLGQMSLVNDYQTFRPNPWSSSVPMYSTYVHACIHTAVLLNRPSVQFTWPCLHPTTGDPGVCRFVYTYIYIYIYIYTMVIAQP